MKYMGRLIVFVLLLGVMQTVAAGKLDEFEKDVSSNKGHPESKPEETAKQDTHDPEQGNPAEDKDTESGIFEDIFGDIFDGLIFALIDGGRASIAKNSRTGSEEPILVAENFSVSPRSPGQNIVPQLRVDLIAGGLESNIDLEDYRFDLGYGAVGISHKKTMLTESTPEDKLELRQTILMYRMTLSDELELDIGAGKYKLDGNNAYTEDASSFSILWNNRSGYGLEYRLTKADGGDLELTDHEAGVHYGINRLSVKIGYRSIKGDVSSLEGPFAGIAFYY
jgi:hypothetical protein